MVRNKYFSFLVVAMTALAAPTGHAVSIGLLGGVNFPLPSVSGGVAASTTTAMGIGGGLRLGFPIGPMWGFSITEYLETWKMTSAANAASTVLIAQAGPSFAFSSSFVFHFGVAYAYQLTKPVNQVPQAFGIYVALPLNIDIGGNTALTLSPEFSFGISSLVTGANGSLMPHVFRVTAGITFGTGGVRSVGKRKG